MVSLDCPQFGPTLLGLTIAIDLRTVMFGDITVSCLHGSPTDVQDRYNIDLFIAITCHKVSTRYSRWVKVRDNITQRLRFLNRLDSTSPRGQMMRRHHLAIHGGEATADVSEPALGHSKMMIQCSAERIMLSSRLASNGGGWRRL